MYDKYKLFIHLLVNMFQKNHFYFVGAALLLIAIIFEVISATQYPSVSLQTNSNSNSTPTNIVKLENVEKFHNLALTCSLVGIGFSIVALNLPTDK